MRVHCCLFDAECRRHERLFAAPLRLHVGHRMLTLWSNNRRSEREWGRAWEEGRVYKRDSDGVLRNVRGEESPRKKFPRGVDTDSSDDAL